MENMKEHILADITIFYMEQKDYMLEDVYENIENFYGFLGYTLLSEHSLFAMGIESTSDLLESLKRNKKL